MSTKRDRSSKRIVKNTLFLYLRMIVTIGVSLYTTRVVLDILGVSDFGVYNVVAGFVVVFGTIKATIASATQRFMSFEMGRDNSDHQLNKIFSMSIVVHVGIAMLVLVFAETIGLWFLNNKMNIEDARMPVANWVFQFAVLSMVSTIVTMPYEAAIMAHERMNIYAFLKIAEVGMNLLVVLILPFLSGDYLLMYALLMLIVILLNRSMFIIYGRKKFKECTFKVSWDKKLASHMISFSGWNFLGTSSSVAKTQGVNVLLNMFFGTSVNAARGVAYQVNGAIEGFVSNLVTAIKPQIVKSYASGDHSYMMSLVYKGSKFAFYMILVLSVPVIIETDDILSLWLTNVPEYTAIFVKLVLVLTLIETLSKTLMTAQAATGDIKLYQLVVSGITLLNLPVSYIFLYNGFMPEVTFVIAIAITIVALIARLLILKHSIGLSPALFIKNVVLNVFIVSVIAIFVSLLFSRFVMLENEIVKLFVVSALSVISTSFVIIFIGMTKEERSYAKNIIINKLEANKKITDVN